MQRKRVKPKAEINKGQFYSTKSMKFCPPKRIKPTRQPKPTAASHAPTLRKMIEKNSSFVKQIRLNIIKTRHSKVKSSLRTLFFFLLKLRSKIKDPRSPIFTTL